jgi:23S rRNA (uridine2552-2'-O)-methyltransferase
MSSSSARKREGWRSRAVFKLAEIQDSERLLRPGIRCVDLGAAPGGWSQYAARIIGGASRIVATDILPMDAIPGVDFVQGDFREPRAFWSRCCAASAPDKVDLVLSDMAPNMAGIDAVDQPRSMYLAELALEFADRVLAPGGRFAGEIISRRGIRSDHPGCPRPLRASGDQKAEGVTNAQS